MPNDAFLAFSAPLPRSKRCVYGKLATRRCFRLSELLSPRGQQVMSQYQTSRSWEARDVDIFGHISNTGRVYFWYGTKVTISPLFVKVRALKIGQENIILRGIFSRLPNGTDTAVVCPL